MGFCGVNGRFRFRIRHMAKAKIKTPISNKSEIWLPIGLGILVTLTFWVPHIDSFNISKFAVLSLGALVLSIAALRSGYIGTKPLGIGALGLLIFTGTLVVNLLGSPNFYKTLLGVQGRNNGVLTYLFLAFISFFVSRNFKSTDLNKLLWGLTGLGVVESLYDVLQLADLDPVKWNNPYGFILGTLGNSDFAAALLAICLVSTLWLINLNRTNKVLVGSLGILSIIETYILINSDVRQSLILFGFGLSIIIYYELSLKKRSFSLAWLSTVFLGGILAVLGALQIGPLKSVIFKESITFRGDYWRAAWRMFKDNPINGVGLGNYGDYFNRYRDAAQVARRGPSVGSDVAHSMPLDFLAMGGVVLGAAYIFLIVLSVVLVLRRIRTTSGDEKRVAVVVFSLLFSYLLQSFISIDQIGLAIWGWIFIGISFSFESSKKTELTKRDKALVKGISGVTAILTLIAFIFVSIPTWRADSALKKLAAVPYEQEGLDTRKIRLDMASKLIAITPHDSQFKTQVSLYLLSNGQAEGIDYAKKALEQNPSDSTALRYLILAYGQLKDEANIAKYKALALEIDPFNPELK